VTVVLSFIKWIVTKVFAKIAHLSEEFREGLQYDTGETIFFWCLFTILASVINMVIVAGILALIETRPSIWVVLWLPLALFIHFVYTGISVMFHCFKQERIELFNTIKNGR
jgi:hypothetical protein